jgi:hypothetical protein
MSIKSNRRNMRSSPSKPVTFSYDTDEPTEPLLRSTTFNEPPHHTYESTEESNTRHSHTSHFNTNTTTTNPPQTTTNSGRFYSEYKKNRPKSDHHHRFSARVLDRRGYFKQSLGVWNIQRRGGAWLYAPFYWDDWFHSLLNAPTRRIFLLLFLLYLLAVLAFAGVYYAISTSGTSDGDGGGCGMDIASMLEAYYFSLSTMTTLGYGVSDYYFGDCYLPLAAISVQVFVSITFDAVAIGVIFQRISRVQKRARTIVFSDKAVIRRIRGRLFFMFQLSEVRNYYNTPPIHPQQNPDPPLRLRLPCASVFCCCVCVSAAT